MSALDDLKAKVTRLRDQLKEAESAYDAALVAASPFRVGQVYANSKGRRGTVCRIDANRYSHNAVPVFQLHRKDGSLGVKRTPMYSWHGWKLAEDQTPATPRGHRPSGEREEHADNQT